jgi:glutamine synthetase
MMLLETDSDPVEKIGGAQLVQQEPDASFLMAVSEILLKPRIYTWDLLLGIYHFMYPTVFISYTGEALDNKIPLLRALSAMDTAATEVCKYFDKMLKGYSNFRLEQEYFFDKSLADSRPDLIMTGRTLLGHTSAKDNN